MKRPLYSNPQNLKRLIFSGITMFLALWINAQTITVTGNVTDGAEGLIGVNVVDQATSKGTVTDFEGNYVIQVSPNDVLVFTFVGYIRQEIPVNGRNRIDVIMEMDLTLLEEVLVVGYGSKKRSDVTGSVVALEEDELKELVIGNTEFALQGRMAGVTIDRTSSRPGGEGQIRIRGNRSLGTDESGVNNPLIILDGIPYSGNLSDISPSEIVNINVLKDASATAIYGSRGANGVILITTRRGEKGAARVFLNTSYGIASAIDHYELFNAEEYADLKQVSNFGAPGGDFTETEIENMLAGRSVDWQELVYKNGYITNNELGVSGGSDNTQYYISLGYFGESTVMPGQEFRRGNLRATLDQKIGKRFKVGLTLMNSISFRDGESVSPSFQLLTMSPLYNAYNEDGTVNDQPAVGSIDEFQRSPLTLYKENSWSQTRRRLRTFNNAYAEVDLFAGLKYRLNAGLDYWQDEYGHFYSSNTPMQNGGGNAASIKNRDLWSYTIENLLIYNKTFGDHNLDITALYSAQEEESNRSGVDAAAVFADFLQYYNFSLAEGLTIPDDPNNPAFQYSKWGLLSMMGRINYGYKSRYLVTLTVRRDGSSRLAEGNKWFTYPAAAVAWNVHNEGFLSGSQAISSLKLRAGIGRTSNQAVPPYASLGSLSRVLYNFGDDGSYGFLVSNLPNKDLTWEFTTSTNFGVDFGLFNNRIIGSVDYYLNNTDNVLQARALPITSGVPGSYQENIGKTKGNGLEVMLFTDIIRGGRDQFNWGLDVNFTTHKEEIVELSEGVERDAGNGWFVGYPINIIYDYEKIGIWQLNEETEASTFGDFAPGDIKLRDVDGNGTIDEDDRVVIGQLDPKWTAGLTSRFSFKGLDLSVIAFTNQGGMLVSNLHQMNQANPYNTLEGRRNGPKVDYWTESNPTNEYPKTGRQITPYGSTVGYFDASFIKIRAINLGYELPPGLMRSWGISGARAYLNVNNPFKAFGSDYVKAGGLDPEPNGRGGTIGAAGFGRRLTVNPDTPPTRAFILGLNISF